MIGGIPAPGPSIYQEDIAVISSDSRCQGAVFPSPIAVIDTELVEKRHKFILLLVSRLVDIVWYCAWLQVQDPWTTSTWKNKLWLGVPSGFTETPFPPRFNDHYLLCSPWATTWSSTSCRSFWKARICSFVGGCQIGYTSFWGPTDRHLIHFDRTIKGRVFW